MSTGLSYSIPSLMRYFLSTAKRLQSTTLLSFVTFNILPRKYRLIFFFRSSLSHFTIKIPGVIVSCPSLHNVADRLRHLSPAARKGLRRSFSHVVCLRWRLDLYSVVSVRLKTALSIVFLLGLPSLWLSEQYRASSTKSPRLCLVQLLWCLSSSRFR